MYLPARRPGGARLNARWDIIREGSSRAMRPRRPRSGPRGRAPAVHARLAGPPNAAHVRVSGPSGRAPSVRRAFNVLGPPPVRPWRPGGVAGGIHVALAPRTSTRRFHVSGRRTRRGAFTLGTPSTDVLIASLKMLSRARPHFCGGEKSMSSREWGRRVPLLSHGTTEAQIRRTNGGRHKYGTHRVRVSFVFSMAMHVSLYEN